MKCLKTATADARVGNAERRVIRYPGFVVAPLARSADGTRDAIPAGMKELALSAEQLSVVSAAPAAGLAAPAVIDDEALMSMPLFEAKRLVAADFERRYLARVMERAGSVSRAAALTGIDRTNFRRLLQRHGLR